MLRVATAFPATDPHEWRIIVILLSAPCAHVRAPVSLSHPLTVFDTTAVIAPSPPDQLFLGLSGLASTQLRYHSAQQCTPLAALSAMSDPAG